MAKKVSLLKKEKKLIDSIIEAYEDKNNILILKTLQSSLMTCLTESEELRPHVHSFKTRLKDSNHLKKKLERKFLECKEKGKTYNVNVKNFSKKINDLLGFRILHLYTDQIKDIDPILKNLFALNNYEIIEGPFARTWDDEYKGFFSVNKIDTEPSKSMYTSVHYVISTGRNITIEIQVRTLMEEVWGEVDHQINYPIKTEVLSCEEQIKVLARVTSSATRLVDSIFRCHKKPNV